VIVSYCHSDPHELKLTPHQMEYLDGWKRAHEALPPPSMAAPDQPELKLRMTVPLKGIDLVQDAVSDCSVVASLCAATSRGEKGHSKVGRHART
jgi:calpain-7